MQMTSKEIYVFDSALPELQKLIDAVSATSTDAKFLILESGSDGVLQLASALAGESNVGAIHIFSHGSAGSLLLGSAVLNQTSLPGYSQILAQIGSALSDSGDLLLYGCNVAQGELGQLFILQVAAATGADVAASTDFTGAASLGGNWALEANTGSIETTSIHSANNYGSVLGYSGHPNYDIALATDLTGLSVASYLTGDALKAQIANLGWTFKAELAASVPLLIDGEAVVVERTVDGRHEMAIAFRGTWEGKDFVTDALSYGFRIITRH